MKIIELTSEIKNNNEKDINVKIDNVINLECKINNIIQLVNNKIYIDG